MQWRQSFQHSMNDVWHEDIKQAFKLEELWVTEDKNIVPIKRLATPHLKNIIEYFRSNPRKRIRETPVYTELLSLRLKFIEYELVRRNNNQNSKLDEAISLVTQARYTGRTELLEEAITLLAQAREK
jgi:hypothetical protein